MAWKWGEFDSWNVELKRKNEKNSFVMRIRWDEDRRIMHWRTVGIHKNEWCCKYHCKTNKNRYRVYNLVYIILNRCFVASTSEENLDNCWFSPLLGRSLKRMEIRRQLKVLWSRWWISLVSSCRVGCSSCIGKPLMCSRFLMAVVVAVHSLSHV